MAWTLLQQLPADFEGVSIKFKSEMHVVEHISSTRWRCSVKNMIRINLANLKENICAGVSFSIKL